MTTLQQAKRRASTGRRKSEETRKRILEAATRSFLSEGFSNCSLEQIAEAAGVTKPTVYSHFNSKQGLFDAVIQHNTKHRLQQVTEILKPSGNLEKDLVRLGDFFLAKLFSPEAQRWDRLAAAESMTHPEVGKAFFEAGPAQLVSRIAEYLKAQKRANRIDIDHPTHAAEQLIGMFICLDLLRVQIGQQPPSRAQQKRRCREAVKRFLRAYGVSS